MPELPEVEVVRRGLRDRITGRQITGVSVRGKRATRRHESPGELVERLVGRTVVDVGRRGKYLIIGLDGPDALIAHLGMSGQLLVAPTDYAATDDPATDDPAIEGVSSRLERHTAVLFDLDCGSTLRFVDPRTFGQVFATPAGPPGELPPALAHLGPDALEDGWSATRLGTALGVRRYRLKALLLDQTVIAGIGNIYADEILFSARLRFDRPGTTLRTIDLRRLATAIPAILDEAIQHRGSSLSDGQYVDLLGEPGSYQHRHQVYGREGEACRRCVDRGRIARSRVVGRSTFFCPRCQR